MIKLLLSQHFCPNIMDIWLGDLITPPVFLQFYKGDVKIQVEDFSIQQGIICWLYWLQSWAVPFQIRSHFWDILYEIIRRSEHKDVTWLKLSWTEVQAAVPSIVYCTAALSSLSDSESCITFLFSEWCVMCKLRRVVYNGFCACIFSSLNVYLW